MGKGKSPCGRGHGIGTGDFVDLFLGIDRIRIMFKGVSKE